MNQPINAAALIIGNEILSGRTQDANINVLARRLSDKGIPLEEIRIVRDVESDIVTALNALRKQYTYVFTTGGIGPTHDDITCASIAKAFGVGVEQNADVVKLLKETRGHDIPEAALKMATYPVGAHLLPVGEGVPPGCYIGNVYVLAGVPRIMQLMLEGVLPLLKQGEEIFSRSVDVLLGESMISSPLETVQNQFMDVDVGSYPFRTGDTYGTSLVVRGTNKTSVETAFAHVEQFLQEMDAPTRP